MSADVDVMVLSPHRDDAAFSCGLLLVALLRAGATVSVVNVCTISDYAPYASEAVRANVQAITSLRASEDAAFDRLLRGDSQATDTELSWIDLAWKDAPLRLELPTEDVLSGLAVQPREVERLAEVFHSLPKAESVVVPLALGGHLDHRLVRLAAARVWGAGELVSYEDLPYAASLPAHSFEAALSWQTPRAHAGLKRQMANCYPSQIADDVACTIETYGADLGWRERLHGEPDALRRLASRVSDDAERPAAS